MRSVDPRQMSFLSPVREVPALDAPSDPVAARLLEVSRESASALMRNGRVRGKQRADAAIHNIYTGSGITDSSHGTIIREQPRPPDFQLQAIYGDTYLGKKIAEKPPRDALQKWPILNVEEDDDATRDPDRLREEAASVMDRVEKLGRRAIVKAATYARAFGGGVVYLGCNDGRPLDQPLDLTRLTEVTHMTVFSPMELDVVGLQNDPFAPDYGEPTHYRVNRQLQEPAHRLRTTVNRQGSVVHASRCVRFNGVTTTVERYERNQWWDDSVFQAILDVLKRNGIAWQTASNLLNKASLLVLRQEGYRNMLTSRNGDDSPLRIQLAALRKSMSASGAIHMDAKDEMFNVTVPMTGVADILDRLSSEIAAATNIPVTILWGVSPSGLNATGDSDWANYIKFLKSLQEWDLDLPLRRICEIIMHSRMGPTRGYVPERWWIEFNTPAEPSALEEAQIRKTDYEAWAIACEAGFARPIDVAQTAFSERGYSRELRVDLDELEYEAEQQAAMREQAMAEAMASGSGQDSTQGTSAASEG